ncbi:MAG: hypothetical protein Fur0032_07670 [Terrimicrobiaceae bacterium]
MGAARFTQFPIEMTAGDCAPGRYEIQAGINGDSILSDTFDAGSVNFLTVVGVQCKFDAGGPGFWAGSHRQCHPWEECMPLHKKSKENQ